jgi:cytochrome P450
MSPLPADPVDPHGVTDAAHLADPYPAYARMRAAGPACFVEPWGAWAVTHYEAVAAGFRDPRLSANRSGAMASKVPPAARERIAPFFRNLSAWALLVDPPDHTRLRGLINKAFTPRVAERLRPAVVEIARALFDDALGGVREPAKDTTIDVVEAIATPLPVTVIGDLLGLPRADRHRLKRWSDALAATMGAARATMDLAVAASDAVVEMEAYFREVVEARRRAPGEDLLSQLLAAREEGRLLSDDELLSTCSMLLFGGHETTSNLIANGVLSLLRNPAQLLRLRGVAAGGDAAAWGLALDELLRFDSPVQRMGRIAREPIEMGGATIPEGDRVFLVMGAAHRDERAFLDPDRLDLDRGGAKPLSFGLGAHYCVGAALGRMEAEIAIGELLRRAPRLALAGTEKDLRWLDNATVRGVERLPVTVRGSL